MYILKVLYDKLKMFIHLFVFLFLFSLYQIIFIFYLIFCSVFVFKTLYDIFFLKKNIVIHRVVYIRKYDFISLLNDVIFVIHKKIFFKIFYKIINVFEGKNKQLLSTKIIIFIYYLFSIFLKEFFGINMAQLYILKTFLKYFFSMSDEKSKNFKADSFFFLFHDFSK